MSFLETVFLSLSPLLMRAGVAALVLASAYLAYAQITGLKLPLSLSSVDRLRLFTNYELGLRVFVWGVALVALGVAYEYFRDEATGYMLAAAGAVLHWGVPVVAASLVPIKAPEYANALVRAGMSAGFWSLAPGTLVILCDVIWRVREYATGKRKGRTVAVPKGAENLEKLPGAPLKCWQSSFCRPYVRELCPRFIEKTPCWKKKEGCFCEEKIILRAMEIKEGGGSFYSEMRKSLAAGEISKPALTDAEKRDRCRRCPIYAEHQRMKYKALVPAAFVVTFLLLAVNTVWIRSVLEIAVVRADKIAMQFKFAAIHTVGSAAQSGPMATVLSDDFQSVFIFWGFMAFLGIMVLTWLLRLVEWLIFKLQV